jgi:hypothetical protein
VSRVTRPVVIDLRVTVAPMQRTSDERPGVRGLARYELAAVITVPR